MRAFPFSAVVGQEEAKMALLLNAVDPRIGGVLLRGEKGSAKTTLARGLAALLAGSAPFVELPIGATEDRLVGTLDVTRALTTGERRFEAGLLAAADGGVLYVDEINLLPDHLVDVLLDVAVSGVNRVEREGVSHSHPSRFVLIGSMNPEEGDLRPQLLDRFGLAATVAAPKTPADRALAVRRRLAWDADPQGTALTWIDEDSELASRLSTAASAALDDALVDAISVLCASVGAEGLRADLTICRAAAALAGWEGRPSAAYDDVRMVAHLALGHRARRHPLDPVGLDPGELADALDALPGTAADPLDTDPLATASPDLSPSDGPAPESESAGSGSAGSGSAESAESGSESAGSAGSAGSGSAGSAGSGSAGSGSAGSGSAGAPPGRPPVTPEEIIAPSESFGRGMSLDHGGQRTRAPVISAPGKGMPGQSTPGPSMSSRSTRGRVVGDRPADRSGGSVALGATARAAALRHSGGLRPLDGPLVEAADLMMKVRNEPQASLVVVVVDASGSMGAELRMAAVKAAVLGLLVDAYQRRDLVALIAFRGEEAQLLLKPTGSVEVARARLNELPTGGRTPLAAGLEMGCRVVAGAARSATHRPLLVVVTDGRATSAGPGLDPVAAAEAAASEVRRRRIPAVVVDVEDGAVSLGLARRLATAMGARHVPLADLTSDGLEHAVRSAIG